MQWDFGSEAILLTIGVFLLRICDVSIGTVRVLFTIRGKRLVSACLGVLESGIFIFAVSRVFTGQQNPLIMIGYAFGFATGTVVGITMERWIAHGTILVRIISRNHAIRLKELLHSEGFGVTAIQGQGYEGNVLVLFVVSPRKRSNDVLAAVRRIDPDAFLTLEPVSHAMGGYPGMPTVTVTPSPESIKK